MNKLVWRNLSIVPPDDWEMLQFSRDLVAGSCAFADRYQIRLEMRWRKIDGAPLMDRIVSDYRSKLQAEQGMKVGKDCTIGEWRGFEGVGPSLQTTRFFRFMAMESCIVEIIFIWPEARDLTVERNVLTSVAEEKELPGGYRHWSAFGMDLAVSGSMALSSVTVKPALAEMQFLDVAHGNEELFGRRGMVKDWLRGSVREWLDLQVPAGMHTANSDFVQSGNHRIDRISALGPAGGMGRLLGRKKILRAAAWICPQDERLYSIIAQGPEDSDFAGMEHRLACCGRKELLR